MQRTLRRSLVEETEPVDVDHDVTLFVARPATDFEIARARLNERLRLRLLNASAREFSNCAWLACALFVMATDGQPAQPFAARESRLSLGPGNRVDVFVDCTLTPGNAAPISIEMGDRASIQIGKLVLRHD